MSLRNFVREIRAENVKDINPLDIIYLAMRDGSIILITDNDEDIIDYENFNPMENLDQIITNANYIKQKYNTYSKYIKASSLCPNENDINSRLNKYSNNSRDKRHIDTTYLSDKNNNKCKVMKININDNNYNNEIKNKINNYKRHNYSSEYFKIEPNINNRMKDEIIDKSSNINYPQRRKYVIQKDNIHNINKTENNNPFNKIDSRVFHRNQSFKYYFNSSCQKDNDEKAKLINQSRIKSPPVRQNFGSKFNIRNNNNLSNLSQTSYENNLINKSMPLEKTNAYNNYSKYNKNNNSKYNSNNRYINNSNNGNQERSLSSNNSNNYSNNNRNPLTPKRYYIDRKEMEIIGKITNYDGTKKLSEHGHPNTLFDPKCQYCEKLAKKNRLNLSNIKEESISDNHTFVAIFGESSKNKEINHNRLGNHYRKVF